jgi:hypothetical protein
LVIDGGMKVHGRIPVRVDQGGIIGQTRMAVAVASPAHPTLIDPPEVT